MSPLLRRAPSSSLARAAGRIGVLLLALGGARVAQTTWPAELVQRRHVQAVRAERTARFYAAWEGADDERRDLAVAALQPGPPTGRPPAFDRLARARHWLEGTDPARAESDLQTFVDLVDMQVVPGAFPSAASGRGRPLVVRLYLLEPARVEGELEVALVWEGPRGERIEARREPFPPSVFSRIGFDMYVRAPLSEPGLWHLVAEVRCGDATARSAPVPVACVERLDERLEALGDAVPPELANLVERGARPLGGRVLERLAWAEGEGTPASTALVGPGFEERLHVRLRRAANEEGPILVFLFPMSAGGDSSEVLFTGPLAEAWRDVAERFDADLVGVEVNAGFKRQFADLLGVLDAEAPERELILVARGDAVPLLHLLVGGATLPIDGIVLAAGRLAPGKALPDVPLLLVPGQAGVIVRDERMTMVPAEAPTAFLSDPALPAVVASWLEAFPRAR